MDIDRLEFLNLPNGVLIKDYGSREVTFVPDISWDKTNQRFFNLPKRRPILTQK